MMRKSAELIYAYLVTNTVSRKKYVGVTCGKPEHRWMQHLIKARKGAGGVLHAAIRSYGEEMFIFEVIAEAYSAEEAIRLERALIAAYGTFCPAGYNMTSGGEGNVGYRLSISTKEIMSFRMAERLKDPAYREKLKQGVHRRNANPEYLKNRQKMQEDPLYAEKYVAGIKKALARPEIKERNVAGKKKMWKSENYRAEREIRRQDRLLAKLTPSSSNKN